MQKDAASSALWITKISGPTDMVSIKGEFILWYITILYCNAIFYFSMLVLLSVRVQISYVAIGSLSEHYCV